MMMNQNWAAKVTLQSSNNRMVYLCRTLSLTSSPLHKIRSQPSGKKTLRLFHQMKTTSSVSLLSPKQVQERGILNFKILDASFHLPNSGRSALDEFKSLPRIPNSQFFDHELIADTNYTINNSVLGDHIKLPHMQPDLFTFKRSMQDLGVQRNHHVLVYDSLGIFSSPRAAWLLNSYGHGEVSVLDGGLPRWIQENGPLEYQVPPTPASSPSSTEYDMKDFDQDWARQKVISYDALVENFTTTPQDLRFNVLDARPRGRFLGTEDEPRPGILSGHIPESISLPFTNLLTTPKDPEEPYRKYLKAEELEKVFLETFSNDRNKWEEIKLGQRGLVFSCGSGMTACIIWLALRLCGAHLHQFKLYDESWSGYALRNNAIIHKSEPA